MLCTALYSAQIFLSGWIVLAQQQSKQTPSVSLAPERPQQIVPPLSPEAQDPLLLRAHQAAEEGSFAEGDATVREFLRQHPSSADAHYLLGYILYRELRAKESLERVHTRGATSKAHRAGVGDRGAGLCASWATSSTPTVG